MTAQPGASLEPGTRLAGRYAIVRLIGQGTAGAVYEGEHLELRRPVAIKVLNARFFENERMVARFVQEARTAAAIRHPGVVEIHDLGSADGKPFIVMELLAGEELVDRRRREHPLPVDFVVRIGTDLAEAVGAAHQQGVVHRDLKPQNVFLARQGRRRDIVKVLDFGLAKVASGLGLTKTGDIFGTPLYMAPEQLRNAKLVDERTDLYAIGVILYECLSGALPFTASSLPELAVKIVRERPQPLDALRPDLPAALSAAVMKAMAKDPGARFQTADELLYALEACAGSV